MYESINTDYDIMKEFLRYGAEIDDKYGIPLLPPINIMPKDTIDFESSFCKTLKNHKKLTVNFYIQDFKFTRFWNNPDKYLQHLSYFHSVISPDFSICTGHTGMPFALNLYNKYRNHALGWYMHINGIKVIPSVSILDAQNYELSFLGIPKQSVVSVCTNGRIKAKEARIEFCEGFYKMCDCLEPTRVILVGRIPQELDSPVEIINFELKNQKIAK